MPGYHGCAAPSTGCGRSACPGRARARGSRRLFEALALTFAAAMPVAKVAAMTREHDTRIWRVLEHHVHAARDQQDFSGVRKVGMDETSARKGQDYVSIFADRELGRALFATQRRSADTLARFAADLAQHDGDPKKITDTSSDMSAAFISGIGEHLPNTGDDLRQVPCGRQAGRSGQRGASSRSQDPPGTQVHPVAVVQELDEPLGEATGRTPPADAALGQARHRPRAAIEGPLIFRTANPLVSYNRMFFTRCCSPPAS